MRNYKMKKYKLSKIQGENESPDPLLSKTQHTS